MDFTHVLQIIRVYDHSRKKLRKEEIGTVIKVFPVLILIEVLVRNSDDPSKFSFEIKCKSIIFYVLQGVKRETFKTYR